MISRDLPQIIVDCTYLPSSGGVTDQPATVNSALGCAISLWL
jgi:hypothetical protein